MRAFLSINDSTWVLLVGRRDPDLISIRTSTFLIRHHNLNPQAPLVLFFFFLFIIYSNSLIQSETNARKEMAAQALVSSSLTSSVETARQILGSRQFPSSRRSSSFVVRASSTPPVKVTSLADLPLFNPHYSSLLNGTLKFWVWVSARS